MFSAFLPTRSDYVILLQFVCALVLMSCSTLPVSNAPEPPEIIVRNRSNADIDTVTLRETSHSQDRVLRFGSISPVPAGVSQSFVRPTNPARLPSTVTLEWIDNQGKVHTQDLSIDRTLQSATGAAGEALVFEIGPYSNVMVYVEQTNAGSPLEGRTWVLIELNNATVKFPAGERTPFIMFHKQEKKATGYSGCNDFFGGYDLKGNTITFSPLGMTRKFCAGTAGEVEQSFLNVLSKVRTWRTEDNSVLLFLSGDTVVARFRPEVRDL